MRVDKIYINNDKFRKQNINFEAQRVDKGMQRFYEVNVHRMPTTLKEYLATLKDKFSITPLEAQRDAFQKLDSAENLEQIQQELFPKEELFKHLQNIGTTRATKGLLGIFREFKEVFENGILKKTENFTIYLLRKIFIEAKTIDEINADLEEDLDEDIKTEFKSRYQDSSYIHSSTLKALGIYMPDISYQNSLRYTRNGYSDVIGTRISEAQLAYWNSLSEDEKFEILSKRCEGRDNWWNALSYEEKLEYVAGVESEDELYANYKKYVRSEKRRLRKEHKVEEPKEREVKQISKSHKKHIKIGSKLEDRDIFVLWFKKNIDKFYSRLSEADKDRVHLKRSRKLALRWQEMSSEERTEFINKMREAREPIRYVMIDAWNHSEVIIKELAAFLKSKQILKPIDLVYATEEFSEFQSKIMTEFWSLHPEFAQMLGKNIHDAYERVEHAMQAGTFEDLQKEILRNKNNRIQAWKREQKQEEIRLKEVERIQNLSTNEKFAAAYKKGVGEKLPQAYTNGMIEAMTELLPEGILIKYTEAINNNSEIPEDVAKAFEQILQRNPQVERMQRALEAAIAVELVGRGAHSTVLGAGVENLVMLYNNRLKQSEMQELSPKQRVNRLRVDKLYDEFSKSLSEHELKYIVGSYFSVVDSLNEKTMIEVRQKLYDYIDLYGRSALIIFSEQSAYSLEQKISFNNKFMEYMPNEIKKYIQPYFVSEKIFQKEQDLQKLELDFSQQYKFLPKEVIQEYMRFIKYVARHSSYSISMLRNMLFRSSNQDSFDGGFLVKTLMPYKAKLKLLAIEKALADELERVLPNGMTNEKNSFYGVAFEALLQTYKYAEESYKSMSLASRKRNAPPNGKNVKNRYEEYMQEFKERQAELPQGEQLSFESILFTLNPYEKYPIRDKLISRSMKRNYGFEE